MQPVVSNIEENTGTDNCEKPLWSYRTVEQWLMYY
jgi:hypothetical protein